MEEKKNKKLVVTALDESKEVSQVLANDTCRAILDAVTDEPLSASQISKKLNIPLTTVDYNLKKLMKVDLIGVDHKRWSPKGKKVNYYAPQEKFIVIAPKMNRAQVIQTLKGMLPIVAIAAVIGTIIEYLTWPSTTQFAFGRMAAAPIAGETAEKAVDNVSGGVANAQAETQIATVLAKNPHYGIWFFIIVLTVILIYTLYKTYRNK